jgi:heme ABC exporter ATP-binding subunit CcmA
MLLINNLSFARSGKKIFENLNLTLNKGDITQIKGDNGSGKTTFLQTVLNILKPDTGEIFWEGKNINKSIFNFYNETTFIMDQSSATKHLTVLDNINFWKGLSSSKLDNDKVLILLESFKLEQYKNTKVMYLSSGEVKKLELLRLIFEQKKFWVLDEPYNHLDDLSTEILNQTFQDHINKDGIVLYASHFKPPINSLAVINFN